MPTHQTGLRKYENPPCEACLPPASLDIMSPFFLMMKEAPMKMLDEMPMATPFALSALPVIVTSCSCTPWRDCSPKLSMPSGTTRPAQPVRTSRARRAARGRKRRDRGVCGGERRRHAADARDAGAMEKRERRKREKKKKGSERERSGERQEKRREKSERGR
eukprot:scaffold8732_cov39-Tisochrysis_lutea.AAC.1